jgi:hypothetical protein
LAFIPFALIQGTGRADITGKLHLLELPFYLALVWFLTVHLGITGTAIAWLLRATADCILLFIVTNRFVLRSMPSRSVLALAGAVIAVFALAMITMSLPERILFSLLVLLAFAATAWFALLTTDERAAIQGLSTHFLPTHPRSKSIGV